MLTENNFSKGFLIDEELMAGVTENSLDSAEPSSAGRYIAFVLRHTTGEYLGYQPCASLPEALEMLNRIPRPWVYESSSGCGGGNCGSEGGCKDGGCGGLKKAEGSCVDGVCPI